MEPVDQPSSSGGALLSRASRAASWTAAVIGLAVGVGGLVAPLEAGDPIYWAFIPGSLVILPPVTARLRKAIPPLRPFWVAPLVSVFALFVGSMIAAPAHRVSTEPDRIREPTTVTVRAKSPPTPPATPAREVAPAPSEGWKEVAIYAAFARKMLAQRLRDPDSMQISDLVVFRTGKKLTLCGMVNAKNGFGGYSGFEPFVISDSGVFVGASEATDKRVLDECRGDASSVVPRSMLG